MRRIYTFQLDGDILTTVIASNDQEAWDRAMEPANVTVSLGFGMTPDDFRKRMSMAEIVTYELNHE